MATDTESAPRTERIIIQHSTSNGVIAGLLACLFGILGIFFIGLIFVPLAALCAITGFVRGIGSGSVTAIGLSIIAGFLCLAGFAVSPSLWVLFGAGLLAGLFATYHSPSPIAPSPHVLEAVPSASYSVVAPNPPVSYSADEPNPLDSIPAKATDLIQHMQRFDDIADSYLTERASAKVKYQAQTSKLNGYFQREQSLVGYPSASVTRGQLSVAISQGSIATDQFHMQVQSTVTQLRNQIAPLDQAVATFKQDCQQLSTQNISSGPWVSSCQDFDAARDKAARKYQDLKKGFSELEAVYQQEHQTQTNLVNASEQIE